MLFRFLEYSYHDLENKYDTPNFISGIIIDKNYDNFFSMLKKAIGMDIEIRDNWYTIDEINFHYDGGEDDLFVCNIYCIGY